MSAMISLKRILLPTDFSENSVHAQKYACAFVEQFDAELHLVRCSKTLPALFSILYLELRLVRAFNRIRGRLPKND